MISLLTPMSAQAQDFPDALESANFDVESLEEWDVIFYAPLAGDEGVYVASDDLEEGETPAAEDDGRVTVASRADDRLIERCSRKNLRGEYAAEKRRVGIYRSRDHGRITLYCGTPDGHGFNHINKNHPESQWRAKMGGPGPWTRHLKFSIRTSLQTPAKVRYKGEGKFCYTAPIEIYWWVGGKVEYVKTFNPSVFISENNKRVVTAIPTTKTTC